ncbi:MAG: glycoside hydrolase family 127 protein [Victivallales bacterium]|nr:glycoside hydrolase family 127 protein [Victivallales bacterium]
MQESNIIKDKYSPLPIGAVKLTGHIGKLLDSVFYHRINSKDARTKVYKETIDAYRNKLDDERKVIGIWQGEFWGKWVISAARAARYQNNDELKSFVRNAAFELMALQESDGCISTYKDPNVFSSAPVEEVVKAIGVPSDWWWNIWCRKYTLWGLLEAADLTGEDEILKAAERLANHLIDSLESRGIDIHQTGTFQGMPSCCILKPMLILYRMTDNERYLKFADFIVSGWECEDGRAPNLIRNALGGKPVHLWYPELKTWTKTYEMLSCFDGLLEYYRLTAHRPALDAAEALYGLLVEHESNCLGGVGYNDQFQHASVYLNSLTEPCDSIHWMRLCFELFKLTGKACYMDTFERTSLNAFLAGICRDGTWGMRAVRSSGHHLVVHEQAKMKYNHCCVDNVPRGLVNMAESCLMVSDEGMVLNQYIPFEATLKAPYVVRVVVSGEYLTTGNVCVMIESERNLRLSLRIPTWSENAIVKVNGKTHDASAGYDDVEIPAGSNEIELVFALHPEVKAFPYPGEPEKLSAWHLRRYLEGVNSENLELLEGRYALLTAGPLFLSRSKLIGNTEEEMFAQSKLVKGNWRISLKPEEDAETMASFQASFTSADGQSFSSKVCDLASAANIDSEDGRLFNMFW